MRNAAVEMRGQYSLGKILGIWVLAAVPMGILSWIVFPAMSPDYHADPLRAGVARIALLTVGLIWLFALSMIIVRREEGDHRWATIARRLRLGTPRDPGTGEPRRRLWRWVIPFLIAITGFELAFRPHIIKLWVSIFPFFAEPPGRTACFMASGTFTSRGGWGRLQWPASSFTRFRLFSKHVDGMSSSTWLRACTLRF